MLLILNVLCFLNIFRTHARVWGHTNLLNDVSIITLR